MKLVPRLAISVAAGGLAAGASGELFSHTTYSPDSEIAAYTACANELPDHIAIAAEVPKACTADEVDLQKAAFSYNGVNGKTEYVLPSASQIRQIIQTLPESQSQQNANARNIEIVLGSVVFAGTFGFTSLITYMDERERKQRAQIPDFNPR